MLFGLYCWNEYLQRRRWQVAAWIAVGLGVSFQTRSRSTSRGSTSGHSIVARSIEP